MMRRDEVLAFFPDNHPKMTEAFTAIFDEMTNSHGRGAEIIYSNMVNYLTGLKQFLSLACEQGDMFNGLYLAIAISGSPMEKTIEMVLEIAHLGEPLTVEVVGHFMDDWAEHLLAS